jgi:hypothetical protein
MIRERKSESVFVSWQKVISPLTIDYDWTFIGDTCAPWTNLLMPCGTRLVTNFWTDLQLTKKQRTKMQKWKKD